MSIRIFTFTALVLLGLAVASPAFSATGPLKLDAIRSQQSEIRAGVATRTGIYKQMSDRDRDLLLREQVGVLSIIGDKQTVDDLNAQQRIALFNGLEKIEAFINSTEDERMICEYRATIGSNRRTRVCITAGEQRKQRENTRNQIQDHGIGSIRN